MIPSPQTSASPEVSDPQLMLPCHQIDAAFHQQCGGEVVAVIAVGQDDVAGVKAWHQLAKQRLLTGVLAAARPQGPLQHGAGR